MTAIVTTIKRIGRWVVLGLVMLAASLPIGVSVRAQAPAVTLVGRALLAATTFADGPRCGVALASNKVINGIAVPFDSEPVGSFSAITRGDYKGTWFLLSDKTSPDCLLRGYVVDIDWRRATSGSGVVNLLDWVTLSDSRKKISNPIKNAAKSGRQLLGADFDPRSVSRANDGTVWIAEANVPSLLHVSPDGIVLQSPISLSGGTLQGVSVLLDNKFLLIALRDGSGMSFHILNLGTGAFEGAAIPYKADAGNTSISDVTIINDHQALIIEQDDQQGAAAKIKRVYLIDYKNPAAPKTLLADLLNIADPANIGTSNVFGSAAGAFGLKPFSFPFKDVSGVYPFDATTLIVVNNNHLPNNTGRVSGVAENTELIAIKLATPLDVQLPQAQE